MEATAAAPPPHPDIPSPINKLAAPSSTPGPRLVLLGTIACRLSSPAPASHTASNGPAPVCQCSTASQRLLPCLSRPCIVQPALVPLNLALSCTVRPAAAARFSRLIPTHRPACKSSPSSSRHSICRVSFSYPAGRLQLVHSHRDQTGCSACNFEECSTSRLFPPARSINLAIILLCVKRRHHGNAFPFGAGFVGWMPAMRAHINLVHHPP